MPSIWNDIPNLQGPPDVTSALQMLSEGLQERRSMRAEEQKRLLSQNIGSRMAGGDMAGAADAAFQSGDMKAGLDITQMAKEDKQKLLSTVGRYAAMADSPDKWNRVVPIFTKLLGPEFAQEYGSFEQRDGLIAETLSLEEQFKLEDRAGKEQEKASKAPDVVNLNGIDHIWDPEARKFVPQPGGVLDSEKKGGGVRLIQHPDGTTETIVGGDGGGTALTGATATDTQKRAISAAEVGSKLSRIAADFKPEYQTVGSRVSNAWSSLKAKVDPASLSAVDKKSLEDFAAYRSSAIGNLNSILKELSGAAVTETERVRIVQEYPNVGTGIFDGDDPVSFKAKLDRTMDEVNRALARYQYYQIIGTPSNLEQIPLNNVQKVKGKWYVKDGDQVFEVGTLNAVQP